MSLSLSNQFSRVKPLYEYLKKRQEDYRFIRTVEVAATFVLISFFLVFAIRPTALTISSLWGDIKSKQILKSQLETKIDNIVKAQDNFSQVQERYQIVENSLPSRPRFAETAEQIQQSGSNSGLTVNSFDYNVDDSGGNLISPNVKEYQVSLILDGSFASTTDFISRLLQNRRLININSLDIGLSSSPGLSNPTSSSSGSINASFDSDYYYWAPAK